MRTRLLVMASGASALLAVGGAGFVGRSVVLPVSALAGVSAVADRLRGRAERKRQTLDKL